MAIDLRDETTPTLADLLPGFTLPMATLFKYLPPAKKPARRKKKR